MKLASNTEQFKSFSREVPLRIQPRSPSSSSASSCCCNDRILFVASKKGCSQVMEFVSKKDIKGCFEWMETEKLDDNQLMTATNIARTGFPRSSL